MTTVTVTATGGGSFVIPAGVTSIRFEAWGSGAGGSTAAGAGAEGSSGGGAYISADITVTPGDTIFYNVPAAPAAGATAATQCWFQKNVNSVVNGWVAGNGDVGSGSNAGTVSGVVGTLVAAFQGGAGVNAQGGGGSRGGSGGGGSAGPLGVGAIGVAGSGSAAGAGGTGNGGNTASNTASAEGGGGGNGGAGGGGAAPAAPAPGGGGGGGGSSSGASAAGSRGQIRYTYTVATPGVQLDLSVKPFLHNLVR